MVMGTCVYHIAHQRMGSIIGNIGRNVEIEQFTQALYDARELAMTRMQTEAEELHAEGIVGVQGCASTPTRGLAHDGVLRHRHGRQAAARGPQDRAADHGFCRLTLDFSRRASRGLSAQTMTLWVAAARRPWRTMTLSAAAARRSSGIWPFLWLSLDVFVGLGPSGAAA